MKIPSFLVPILQKIAEKCHQCILVLLSLERIQVIFVFFALFGLVLISTCFRYTVFDYAYYKNLADNQQTMQITNPVSRGTIYSSNTPPGIFATSTSLPDLAVDPGQAGDKVRLVSFLTDIVYNEICPHTDQICYNALTDFLRINNLDDYSNDPNYIKGKINANLTERINKPYVDSVLLKTDASASECAGIALLGNPAISCTDSSVFADPTKIGDLNAIVPKLQSILGGDTQSLQTALKLRPVRYIKILRKMSMQSKDIIDARIQNEKEALQKGLLSEKDSISNFLILEPIPTRFYPEKDIGGQITGFVDDQNVGHYGIEGYFDNELRGQNGVQITKKDVTGRTVGTYDPQTEEMVNGVDITLTIDRNVQKQITQILSQAISDYKANKGSVVVMDPKTGNVISMVNYPDFDPNNYGDVYQLERVPHVTDPGLTYL